MSGFAYKAITASLVVASISAVVLGLPGSEAPRSPREAAKAAPAAAPRCRFEPGATAAFTLESTARDVRGDEEDHLRGILSWQVVDQSASDRWRLRAALSDVSHTQALTLPSERVQGPLTDPFFVDVDAACRFVGFGFDREWDARRRQLIQTTLLTHEYVVPSSTRRMAWSTRQTDGLGDFEASYAIVPGEGPGARVERHKAAYEGAAQAAAFGLELAVVGSESAASFDHERRDWLRASSGLERVQIMVEGEVVADLLQRFRLTRDDRRYAPVPAMDPKDADFRDAFALEVERGEVVDERTAQMSYDEALEAFQGLFQGTADDPSYAAARQLAAWLKTHPEGAAALVAALRGGEIDDVARPALFLALELSGTDAAREVLSDVLVDARLRPVDRARAASALSDLGEPTRGTAELLLTQAKGDGDAMVANVSLLGLGNLAKRSGDDDLRAYVRDALDRELAAADEGRTRVLLDAMGNSGDPSFTDEVAAHLVAESPMTRQHAAEALGRLDPAASGPRLLERLGEEKDPAVRATIVGAYHGPATADAIARMSDTLAASTSTSERAALIAWLGAASRTEPEAQDQLVAHLQRETDARLMQAIGAYVPAAALR
ncbi:MAG: HEAT repeat domain-containing protein [Nannocystaceae bacterium]